MSKTYDSVLLCRAAYKLQDAAEDMMKGIHSEYLFIGQTAQSELDGECAEAIAERMEQMDAVCVDCVRRMNEISELLSKYASALELADEKASELIRNE